MHFDMRLTYTLLHFTVTWYLLDRASQGKRFLQGRKVVNVVEFRRGHSFLQEILNLVKPFGGVVRHLVLDARPEVCFHPMSAYRMFFPAPTQYDAPGPSALRQCF